MQRAGYSRARGKGSNGMRSFPEMAEKVRCTFSSPAAHRRMVAVDRRHAEWRCACRRPITSHSSQPFAGKRYTHPSEVRLPAGTSAGARSTCETIKGAPQPDPLTHRPPTNLPPPRLPFPPPRACPPLTTTIPTVYRVGGAVATRATIGATRCRSVCQGRCERCVGVPGRP